LNGEADQEESAAGAGPGRSGDAEPSEVGMGPVAAAAVVRWQSRDETETGRQPAVGKRPETIRRLKERPVLETIIEAA